MKVLIRYEGDAEPYPLSAAAALDYRVRLAPSGVGGAGISRCAVSENAGVSLSRHSLGGPLGKGLLTFIMVILLTACSSSSPRVSSLHYTEVRSDEGETPPWRFEVFYQAPDSLRIRYPSVFPFSEAILIGSQAWMRYDEGWYVANPDSVYGQYRIEGILALSGRLGEFEDVGAGPDLNSERTRRYRQVSEFKNVLEECEYVPKDVLQLTRDLFRDVDVTTEVVVGDRTNHVYQINETFIGPNLNTRSEIKIDQYDMHVTIEPPPDVLPTPGSPQPTAPAVECPTE